MLLSQLIVESDIVPPKVLSRVIGRYFAEFTDLLLDKIHSSNLTSAIAHLDDGFPMLNLTFDTSDGKPEKPKAEVAKALAKKLKLDPKDWKLNSEYHDVHDAFEINLTKQSEFDADKDELRKGIGEVNPEYLDSIPIEIVS